MFYKTTYSSPIGSLIIGSDGDHLTHLLYDKEHYSNHILQTDVKERDNLNVFKDVKKWLDGYFAKKKPSTENLPLLPQGSDFQSEVWKQLVQIPYGEITTYGDIAKKIAFLTDKPHMAPRAVGGAIGSNPISIIIPCHRVIGAGGNLTGYGGGIQTKVQLLLLEGHDMANFRIPKKGTAL